MKGKFQTSIIGTVLFAIVALGASEAKADPVTFSTSGTFNCDILGANQTCSGGGTNAITLASPTGSLTITFLGTPSATVNTPTSASFGSFQVSVTGSGMGASNIPFALTITQTSPIMGSQTIPAIFSGAFTANSGVGHFPGVSLKHYGHGKYRWNPIFHPAKCTRHFPRSSDYEQRGHHGTGIHKRHSFPGGCP